MQQETDQKPNQPQGSRNKLLLPAVGVLVLLVLALGVVYFLKPGASPFDDSFLGLNITQAGNEAFGELAVADQLQSRNQSGPASTSRGEAGGDGSSTPESTFPIGFGGGGDIASPIFPADLVRYRFVYQGKEFSIDEATMAVFKRIKGKTAFPLPRNLTGSLSNLVNLGSFGGLTLQSTSASQGTDSGFDVYIDYREERVSINKTYPFGRSQEIIAPPQISDVPSDESLIAAANRFLNQHGVNLENYGTPEVRNEWLIAYERAAADQSQFYIPNNISVIYPLVIDGQEVFDQSGYKSGIGVNVKIPGPEVIGVWDIGSLNFQSSAYVTETDVARILGIAERGGVYGFFDYPEANRTIDVPLGTPEPVLVKIWQWDGTASTELLVPALRFPITELPDENYFFQESIVIPIIKQILDSGDRGPVPVPLLEEAQ